jgi:hypothetical protein
VKQNKRGAEIAFNSLNLKRGVKLFRPDKSKAISALFGCAAGSIYLHIVANRDGDER